MAKPAYAVLNTAAWQGAAPPPLDPMAFRATGGTAGGGGPPPEPRPRFVPTAVPRRSAKRRSAIAANPSPAILRASARDLSGVEGAEPLVSLFVATKSMLA